MKRLFISQPMQGVEAKKIKAARAKAVETAKEQLREPVYALDSYFDGAPAGAEPLWYLSKAIEILSSADVAYFVKGWEDHRGCRIEHQCAADYGIPIIEE